MTTEQMESLNKLNFMNLDRTKLVDIGGIKIDPELPAEQRMADYLEQVKNPYYFLCGDTTVHVRFDPAGEDLRKKLERFMIRLKGE